MENQKVTTYGDLKCRRADLQAKINGDSYTREMVEEFRYLNRWIKQAESVLLWSITCLIVIVALGCQTLKGVTGDTAWTLQKLSDNIQTTEK